MLEEEFDSLPPSKKRERTQRIKSKIVEKVLAKDKKLNAQFDKMSAQLIVDDDRPRMKASRRKHGRPKGGLVTFEQARIDALPESGYAADIARALGIKRASLQQWCRLKKDPLPYVSKEGHTILRKDILIKWLIKTKRYKHHPEYVGYKNRPEYTE